MPTTVLSGATIGLNSILIEVEVDSTPGLHCFTIVGLPDKAVEESKDRVGAAIKNSGFTPPKQKNNKIVVNLAPADIRKQGPSYDLPIAVGYLLASKQLRIKDQKKRILVGELSLDGRLRPINGALSLACMTRDQVFDELILPKDNLKEACLVPIKNLIGVQSLKEVTDHLSGESPITSHSSLDKDDGILVSSNEIAPKIDMNDICGQENAKRALTIAASGNHNIIMNGPPGSGKTLLASAIPGILPVMEQDEIIEVTKIYSVSGLTKAHSPIYKRPFRNPHHTASSTAIIGGGSWPKPGEISLSHRGVLFLDEFPEFPRNVIEALRQPLENGSVTISRALNSLEFPARFMLVVAMNPCPCGNYGNEFKPCVCTINVINKYRNKVSGPVLDRIDIQINVPRETHKETKLPEKRLTSAHIKDTVMKTRAIQRKRFDKINIYTNSEMGLRELERFCSMENSAKILLKKIATANHISMRSYHKILKIARTIADINESEIIRLSHIAEASGYRINFETMI